MCTLLGVGSHLFALLLFGTALAVDPQAAGASPAGESEAYWELYFEKSDAELRLGPPDEPFRVRFLPDGSEALLAPHHPAIAVDHPRTDRWIQIVTVNCTGAFALPEATGPTWHLSETEPPWVFLDGSPGNRSAGAPFYWDESLSEAQKRRFFDNPEWAPPRRADWPDGYLEWRARTYAVEVEGDVISLVGGLGWGYVHYVGASRPVAVHPTLLGPNDWGRDVDLIDSHCSDWTFRRVSAESSRLEEGRTPPVRLIAELDFDHPRRGTNRLGTADLEAALGRTRLVSSPTRSGRAALEVSLERASGAHRTDFYVRGLSARSKLGREYWYGFSVCFPEDWEPDTQSELFVQWVRTTRTPRGPQLALYVSGEEYVLRKRWDPDPADGRQAVEYANLWRGSILADRASGSTGSRASFGRRTTVARSRSGRTARPSSATTVRTATTTEATRPRTSSSGSTSGRGASPPRRRPRSCRAAASSSTRSGSVTRPRATTPWLHRAAERPSPRFEHFAHSEPETARRPPVLRARNAPMTTWKHWVPVFTVRDAAATGEFYTSVLGFSKDWEHRFGDGFPLYVQVSRDSLTLHLSEHGEPGPSTVFISVDDVDAVYREVAANGLEADAPRDQPYGVRDFAFDDPAGNRITIGTALADFEESPGRSYDEA